LKNTKLARLVIKFKIFRIAKLHLNIFSFDLHYFQNLKVVCSEDLGNKTESGHSQIYRRIETSKDGSKEQFCFPLEIKMQTKCVSDKYAFYSINRIQ
jgi:hypothetical protein